MKFKIVQSSLISRLKAVNGIIDTKGTQPILSHLLIEADAEKNQLRLTGTDTEIQLSANLRADVEESGSISVPSDMFFKIVDRFASDDLITCTATPDDGQFQFTTGKNSFSLMTLPAEDFPLSEPPSDVQQLVLDGASLHHLLQRTIFSMAENDVRAYLNGLYLTVLPDGQTIESVTTDGHRLSTARAELAESTGENAGKGIIIPKKAAAFLSNYSRPESYISALEAQKAEAASVEEMNEINSKLQAAGKNYKSLSREEQIQALPRPITLRIAERELAILDGEYEFITRLIDGNFPNYQQIIPAEEGTPTIQTDSERLQGILKRMLIVLGKTEKGVAMHIEGGHTASIAARNAKNETADEELDIINPEQISCSVGVNAEYLLNVIDAMDSRTLRLHISDANAPLLFTGSDDPGLRYVIMPMRL